MAAPVTYTREEIMRRYNCTAVRVASWQKPVTYARMATGQLRDGPQMYRYVIPQDPKVPEATDDEESEADEDNNEGSTEAQPESANAAESSMDDILAGILRNTSSKQPAIESPAEPVAAQTPASSEVKPKPKIKSRSAWSKPSSKTKSKPTKTKDAKAEKPAAVAVAPEAPTPPSVVDIDIDALAALAVSQVAVEPAVIITKDETSVEGPPVVDVAEPATGEANESTPDPVADAQPTESNEEAAPKADSEPVPAEAPSTEEVIIEEPAQDEAANEAVEATTETVQTADEQASSDPLEDLLKDIIQAPTALPATVEDVQDVEEAPTSQASSDPLDALLAEISKPTTTTPADRPVAAAPTETVPAEEETPVAASSESKGDSSAASTAPAEEKTPVAAPPNSKDDPLAALLAGIIGSSNGDIVVPDADEIVAIVDADGNVIADDDSAVISLGSEDKHVSFAPGTPEPKPTKRKKRNNKDSSKNKRRSSITTSDAAKPEIEVPASQPAPESTTDAPLSNEKSVEPTADGPAVVVIEAKPSEVQAPDAIPSISKKGTIRPRSSSKSAGMFAAGGLLAFAGKSKSKSKSKDQKKRGDEKKSKSDVKPADDAIEPPAVGLGIDVMPDIIETEASKVEEAAADPPAESAKELEVTETPQSDAVASPSVQEAPMEEVEKTHDTGAELNSTQEPPVDTMDDPESSIVDIPPEEVSQDVTAEAAVQNASGTIETDAVTEAGAKTQSEIQPESEPKPASETEPEPQAEPQAEPDAVLETTVVATDSPASSEDASGPAAEDSTVEVKSDDPALKEEHPELAVVETEEADIGPPHELAETSAIDVPTDLEDKLGVDEPEVQVREQHETAASSVKESAVVAVDVQDELLEQVIRHDSGFDESVEELKVEQIPEPIELTTIEKDEILGAVIVHPVVLDISSPEGTSAAIVEAEEAAHTPTSAPVDEEECLADVIVEISPSDANVEVQDEKPDILVDDTVTAKAEEIVVEAAPALDDREVEEVPASIDEAHESPDDGVKPEVPSEDTAVPGITEQAPLPSRDDTTDAAEAQTTEVDADSVEATAATETDVAEHHSIDGEKNDSTAVVEHDPEVSVAIPGAPLAPVTDDEVTAKPQDEVDVGNTAAADEGTPVAADPISTDTVAVQPEQQPEPSDDPVGATEESSKESEMAVEAGTAVDDVEDVAMQQEPASQDVSAEQVASHEDAPPVEPTTETQTQPAGSEEPFATEIVVPIVASANVKDTPPSPDLSKTSRRRRSTRGKSPRQLVEDFRSREKRNGGSARSSKRNEQPYGDLQENVERRRRRDARKAEESRRIADEERRLAEEEEHRRLRREARRASRKAQEAEEAARLAREEVEALARQEAEARRRRREQNTADRSGTKDGEGRPKLLPLVSALSSGSSVSRAGLFVRTKDDRDGREDKRTSREIDSKRRERRDSGITKPTSPVEVRSAERHSGSDRGSTRSRTDPEAGASSKAPGGDPRNAQGRSEGERRRRSDRTDGERPHRSRRTSDRNDKRTSTETKASGFFSSFFKASR